MTGEPAADPATEADRGAEVEGTAYERHLEELLTSIQRHVRNARHGSEESIHDLRVDFKRLRAALYVLHVLDPEGRLREAARPLRRLFRAAAPLRDVHVHRSLFEKHMREDARAMSEWVHALTARELSARLRFFKVTDALKSSELHLMDEVHKVTASLSASDLEWQARFAFAVLASRLADLSPEPGLHDVDWHRLRRITKDARYLLILLEELSASSGTEWDAFEPGLKEVHRALGGWHDATVATGDLQNFRDGRERPLRHLEAWDVYARRLADSGHEYAGEFKEAWSRLLPMFKVA